MLLVVGSYALSNCTGSKLGIESSEIPSENIRASSEYDAHSGAHRGRLNIEPTNDGIGAWAAKTNDLNQWIQVDLNEVKVVTGVITQGRNNYSQWVKSYEVLYGMDSSNWQIIVITVGTPKVFVGNTDTDTQVTNLFPFEIHARFIRINPMTWNNHICMRFEILGCPVKTKFCTDPLGVEEGTIALTASTQYDARHGPEYGRLNTTPKKGNIGAWGARSYDQNQWIQADIGALKWVTGVITQGRNWTYSQWVTTFEVLYSIDGNNFKYIIEADDTTMEFVGNANRNSQVTNLFPKPVIARYIRIHPTAWLHAICLRFEVLGCSDVDQSLMLTCPANVTLPTDKGVNTALVDYSRNITTSLSEIRPDPTSYFPAYLTIGQTFFKFYASDDNSNEISCTFKT
ncbi:lactadherin-like [Antedon mediterranea]|uniref:lactadherin-like n=1 Tax=Antedon mediterranea TaxID=105859 RepID=UPI003AF78E8B